MKWRVLASALFVLATGIFFVADAFLDRILNAQLPKYFTAAIGLPVFVDQLEVDLFSLRVRATSLSIGAPDHPALSAKTVEVSLDGGSLVKGILALQSAKAASLNVDLLLWSGDKHSQPTDQATIVRWQPETAELGTLQIFNGERRISATRNIHWTRHHDGQSLLTWTHAGLPVELTVRAEFTPLVEFLNTQRGKMHLEVSQMEADSTIVAQVNVEPMQAGTKGVIELDSLALAGRWQFASESILAWPKESQLRLERLDIDKLQTMLDPFVSTNPANNDDWLQTSLPSLPLPNHRTQLQIMELLYASKGISKNVEADIVLRSSTASAPATLQVNDLRIQLPRADVSGGFSVASGPELELALDIVAEAHNNETLSSSLFLDAEWLWQRGTAKLSTRGSTPIEMLDHAAGTIGATGTYVGNESLPMRLSAQFDNSRGLQGADAIEIQIGESKVVGSIWTDNSQHSLTARLSSPHLNIDQLQRRTQANLSQVSTGFRIPDLTGFRSGISIDVAFTGKSLELGGRRYHDLDLELLHSEHHSNLDLALSTSGTGGLKLSAVSERQDAEQSLQLALDVNQIALADFGINTPATVSTGTIFLEGRGASLPAIAPNLAGQLHVQLDVDYLGDTLIAQAGPTLHVDQGNFVAVSLTALKMKLGDEALGEGHLHFDVARQALSGTLMMTELDVGNLFSDLDKQASPTEITTQLKEMLGLDLELQADKVIIRDQTLSDVAVALKSRVDGVDFSGLSFTSKFGQVRGQGNLAVVDEKAKLTLSSTLEGLHVKTLTGTRLASILDRPLDGKVSIAAEGLDWGQLAQNARLHLQLKERADTTIPPDPPKFDIDVELRPQTAGIRATVNSVHWLESDARGTIDYQMGDPPNFSLDLKSEFLDVSAFEPETTVTDETPRRIGDLLGTVTRATRQTLGFLSGAVTERFGPGVTSPQTNSQSQIENRLFSTKRWSIEPFSAVVADVNYQVTRMISSRVIAEDVTINAKLADSLLELDITSADLNGGPLDISLSYAAAAVPARAKITMTANNIRPNKGPDTAPLSMFVSLTGEGNSETQLAGNANGQMYLAGGRGNTDFASLSADLLSGDIIESVFSKLVPDRDSAPQLSCAIAYGEITQGAFETPATLFLRTKRANILVKLQADLANETIKAQFDSRSRSGTGINVTNVFSNTVKLEGSLLAPKIVPQTRSLLWRYGAAVATGGLSLLGEGVYKRIMAEHDPCSTLTQTLREQICGNETPAAKSPLVCP